MDYNFQQRKQILAKAILEAGYSVGLNFMEANKDVLMVDEQTNRDSLDCEFADQMSESLNGDSQADDIFIDEKIFKKDEFAGSYPFGNHWNVLERYFDEEEVESIFMRGWHQFLYETYGI